VQSQRAQPQPRATLTGAGGREKGEKTDPVAETAAEAVLRLGAGLCHGQRVQQGLLRRSLQAPRLSKENSVRQLPVRLDLGTSLHVYTYYKVYMCFTPT
jgi:hypothetical protein